jgi:hypothetical protein
MKKYPLAATGIKYCLSYVSPQIIEWYSKEYKTSEKEAVNLFYNSKLYSKIEDELTALWHLSPKLLAQLLHDEVMQKKVIFPEEAA